MGWCFASAIVARALSSAYHGSGLIHNSIGGARGTLRAFYRRAGLIEARDGGALDVNAAEEFAVAERLPITYKGRQ
jgi:hypothetical protein